MLSSEVALNPTRREILAPKEEPQEDVEAP